MKNDILKLPEFEDGMFTTLILGFISHKRSCGLRYGDSASYNLRVICRKLNQHQLEHPKMTKEMVEDLVEKRPHESFSTQSRRISLLRQLAIYLNRLGVEAYIYPEQSKHKEAKTFVPYLFSDNEIRRIFEVADNLAPMTRWPHYQDVYPVLLRLLYAGGLRLSEALNLKLMHFDDINNTLTIENSKKGKSRVIPVSVSMSHVITKYMNKRFGGTNYDRDRYIFEAPDGNCYNRGSLRSTIIKIFKTAGIPVNPSERHARVHDLRHLFSVKAMEKMKLEGMDLYCALPLLSLYLGHEGIRETEKYLWLPEFRMEELAELNQYLPQGMIPEVQWDEE